jgi:hypothetical protein
VKKILVALAIAALSSAAWAQQRNFDAVQIKTTQVADGLYMLEGEGGNIGVSAGEDGGMGQVQKTRGLRRDRLQRPCAQEVA